MSVIPQTKLLCVLGKLCQKDEEQLFAMSSFSYDRRCTKTPAACTDKRKYLKLGLGLFLLVSFLMSLYSTRKSN